MLTPAAVGRRHHLFVAVGVSFPFPVDAGVARQRVGCVTPHRSASRRRDPDLDKGTVVQEGDETAWERFRLSDLTSCVLETGNGMLRVVGREGRMRREGVEAVVARCGEDDERLGRGAGGEGQVDDSSGRRRVPRDGLEEGARERVDCDLVSGVGVGVISVERDWLARVPREGDGPCGRSVGEERVVGQVEAGEGRVGERVDAVEAVELVADWLPRRRPGHPCPRERGERGGGAQGLHWDKWGSSALYT